jgi:hypothetical protein
MMMKRTPISGERAARYSTSRSVTGMTVTERSAA